MYSTNKFLNKLYNSVQPEKKIIDLNNAEFEEEKKIRVEKLKELFKLDELNQLFDKEITYKVEDNFEEMSIQIDKYRLDAIEGLEFPVYHIKPENPNGKVILYLHGHDDLGIMGALLERHDKVRYHKMMPLKLAKEGYEIYAPELIGHGDAHYEDFPTGSGKNAGCVPNSNFMTLLGFSLGGFRVYQTIRTLDFIEKLGVSNKLTVFGISGGGMTAEQILPLEDRLDSGVIACYPNTYEKSILAKDHCCCNYVPGLLRMGDSYELLALSAPKKLYTVNGKADRGFPMAGSEEAFKYLRQVYDNLGISDNYTCELIEGRHEISEEAILAWFKNNV